MTANIYGVHKTGAPIDPERRSDGKVFFTQSIADPITSRSANVKIRAYVGLMLCHRLRRWPNINPA